MVFSSLLFIFVFLPITLLSYYLVPKSLKNLVILISSLIFYAWGEPIYIFLMMFSTIFNYIIGLIINKYKTCKRISLAVFILSVVVNLSILGFFKYYGFFIDNLNALLGLSIEAKKLSLPLGISFYTFQTMSYVIDVYWGKTPVQKNIITFGTYITMFPQLVAGPIVKYDDVEEQLKNRRVTLAKFGSGAEMFIIGLSKKVLLANNIGILWRAIKATPAGELPILSAWLGIIGFTFQIYYDFSGYSDMAIGLGRMFGFELMKNFDYPYISKSITEFWRRWHISLGSWFREYVYIPLGGNRVSPIKRYRNLFVVWFLTGFWHGANWNFIFWGLYFGVILALEKAFILKWLENKPKIIAHTYAFLLIVFGWILFEFENMSLGLEFIKTLFGFTSRTFMDTTTLYYISNNSILFVLLILCATPLPWKLMQKLKGKVKFIGAIIIPLIYLLLIFICTSYLVNESYNPFLYFKF